MEHHYLITEPIPEIEAMGDQRLPIGTDFEGNIYFRQEGKGMLLGTYEPKSTPWKVEGTPMNFGHELLEPKLDNIEDRLAIGFERMPALERAGIKNIVNGPFTFGPDGSPSYWSSTRNEKLLGCCWCYGWILPRRWCWKMYSRMDY